MALLAVGDLAPDFSLQTHRGDEVKLSALKGQTVVLWWYPKADTPGCTIEGCGFRDQYPEYEAKQVKVFGISCDTVEENRAFAEKFDFPFPLLCDPSRKVSLAYGAVEDTESFPKRITYVISAEGRIAEVHGQVDVKSHPEALSKSL
jgi:thioredoxin-dependent peroxiredoxin